MPGHSGWGAAATVAKQQSNNSLAQYGWGAGLLFLGYSFFELPSNLALERFGMPIIVRASFNLISPDCGRRAGLRHSHIGHDHRRRDGDAAQHGCGRESDKPGGRCLNYACIPAKTVLHTAHVFDQARNDAAGLGIKVEGVSLDWDGLGKRREAIARGIPMVMVGHAIYRGIDSEAPAALSPAVVDGLLREQLPVRDPCRAQNLLIIDPGDALSRAIRDRHCVDNHDRLDNDPGDSVPTAPPLQRASRAPISPQPVMKISVCVGSSFLSFSSVSLRPVALFGNCRAHSENIGFLRRKLLRNAEKVQWLTENVMRELRDCFSTKLPESRNSAINAISHFDNPLL